MAFIRINEKLSDGIERVIKRAIRDKQVTPRDLSDLIAKYLIKKGYVFYRKKDFP